MNFPNVDYWILLITLLFIVCDIASGIVKAVYQHNVSSEAMRNGVVHKSAYIIIIALAYLIDWGSLHMGLGFSGVILPSVCAYICLTEVTSIWENCCKINPDLPLSKLFAIFDNISEKEGKNA